ncbi:hypothetical protein HO133_009864 [Letharia lupina]|uniref:Uncharacterized protein n=1 Tax=Letharia lupina TaxID=560253 RepID=A0A8H6FET3_9LECA|nr:uncharacterized protein HO133_009864 [Letharia lupina]KAF6225862.1 hypothetical protein HO133_009864 [Letharia lupina]
MPTYLHIQRLRESSLRFRATTPQSRATATSRKGRSPLVSTHCGKRLGKILSDRIRAELPMLIGDMEGKINDGRGTLVRLGPDRDGWDQQRLFLLQISPAFQTIFKAAPDGVDGHNCFGESHG